MIRVPGYISIALLLLPFHVLAQEEDTTLYLPEATVVSGLPGKIQGVRETVVEDVQNNPAGDLGTLLESHTHAIVRSNGPGSSATVSYRGTGAAHTRLTWNGMPIGSAMLGQTDLSLIPQLAFDRVRILNGGASGEGDGGAIGASIEMQTKAPAHQGARLGLDVSGNSIGGYRTSGSADYGGSSFSANLRLSHADDQNLFLYHNNSFPGPDYPLERRKNTSFRSNLAMAGFHLALAGRREIHAGIWAQSSSREIPTSLLVPDLKGNESQDDEALRAFVNFQRHADKSTLRISGAFSNENMRYINKVAGIDAVYRIEGFFHTGVYTLDLPKGHTIRGGESLELYRASSAAYTESKDRILWKAFAMAFGPISPRVQYFILVREEWFNQRFLSPVPSAGLSWKLPVQFDLRLKTNISRNQRIPSMNDLYWNPGGNPDLLPEVGWQGETGFRFRHERNNVMINSELTAYYGEVSDWIQWLPHPELNYWTPVNLPGVRNSGLEFSIDARRSTGVHTHVLHLHYGYASTINDHISADDADGKQLIYVPRHSGRLSYSYGISGLLLEGGGSLIGKRYTTSSNSRYMPAHLICDARISHAWPLGNWKLKVSVEVNNILNSDYQVVAWYPMPLRYFIFSTQLRPGK